MGIDRRYKVLRTKRYAALYGLLRLSSPRSRRTDNTVSCAAHRGLLLEGVECSAGRVAPEWKFADPGSAANLEGKSRAKPPERHAAAEAQMDAARRGGPAQGCCGGAAGCGSYDAIQRRAHGGCAQARAPLGPELAPARM